MHTADYPPGGGGVQFFVSMFDLRYPDYRKEDSTEGLKVKYENTLSNTGDMPPIASYRRDVA